jgi:hypothetical protein
MHAMKEKKKQCQIENKAFSLFTPSLTPTLTHLLPINIYVHILIYTYTHTHTGQAAVAAAAAGGVAAAAYLVSRRQAAPTT